MIFVRANGLEAQGTSRAVMCSSSYAVGCSFYSREVRKVPKVFESFELRGLDHSQASLYSLSLLCFYGRVCRFRVLQEDLHLGSASQPESSTSYVKHNGRIAGATPPISHRLGRLNLVHLFFPLHSLLYCIVH